MDEEQRYRMQLEKAAKKYVERNAERLSVWRRGGVKGQLHDAYAKSERLFFQSIHEGRIPIEDDLVDIINYAAFALILIDEAKESSAASTSRDVVPAGKFVRNLLNGSWPW